ncbi:MAG: glycosyltransferase family 4 protein [Fimbriimonadia bacterium]|nr:glycosyltransferase family 4 protein [Fimbriimonadia bacterium]
MEAQAKKRKVLLVLENLPVPQDRRMWQLATSLQRAGYHVSIISPRPEDEPDYKVLDGVHLYRYPMPPPTHSVFSFFRESVYCWWKTFRLSLRVWRRQGFDVFHAANPLDTFWSVGLFYKLFGKKVIYEHRDLCPEMYVARFHRHGILYRGLVWLEKISYDTADLVIEMNESYRQTALQRGGVQSEKIAIVRSGPRKSEFQPQTPDPALKQGKKFLVGYLGVMGPQDGADIFVKTAFEIIHQRGFKDIHFMLIGNGDAYESVRQLARDLDLEDYTTFTGFVSDRPTLLRYMSSWDVGVASDPENDYTAKSTMNKVLEYMALGVPVVATHSIENHYSAKRALVSPENATPEAFADVIIDLLDDSEKRRQMSEYGKQRFQDCLAWEHSEDALLTAYDRLFKDQRPFDCSKG